jgi:Flp pilus assembly protein TadD
MRKICLLTIGLSSGMIGFSAQGQVIHITIPRYSEMTPVQRLNRDGVDEVVRHKYEKAEALFLKAYLFDPADPFTLNNLGYISELEGEVDRAADYYKLAVEQGCDAVIDRSSDRDLKGKPMMDALGTIKNIPMRVNRINTYAIQLLSQKRAFEAETLLEQTLALDPQNPFTLNNLAVAEEATGNFEEAVKHYEAAAATHSVQPVVVSLKRSSRGKPISAVASSSAADLRSRMANIDMRLIRADMFAMRGVAALNKNDWAAARDDFEKSYSEDPEGAFALNNLGYLAERDGDLETALSFYARAQRAMDATDPVGMASQATVRGQRLAAVASVSHQSVDVLLDSQKRTLPNSSEPIELLRRDGSSEPPANPSIQPTTPVPSLPSSDR